jgi:hypothetical protein
MDTPLKLWEYIIGIAAIFVGIGAAWGWTRSKIVSHDKAIEACHIESLMTEPKCERMHAERDRLTQMQLANQQKIIDQLVKDRNNADQRWGALSTKIDVIIDRMGRGIGDFHGK